MADVPDKPPHGYPEQATPEWVDKVVDITYQTVLETIHYELGNPPARSKILQEDEIKHLEDNQLLRRAIRGFVVEFLRQTAEGTEPLFIEPTASPPGSLTRNARKAESKHIKRFEENTYPGVFHSAALLRQLVDRGVDQDAARHTLGIVIRRASYEFGKEYIMIDKIRPPRATVRHNVDLIFKVAGLERMSRSTTI